MSTKRCSLYDDHSLTTLPEPATLEDAFKTSCLLAFDPDTGLLTLVDGTFAYIYNFGGSNGGSSGGGGETEVDSDGDGLLDDLENTTCTEVNNDDTDGDGLLDGTEDANLNGLLDMGETDPCNKDTDNDGYTACYELKKDCDTHNIPVLILTALPAKLSVPEYAKNIAHDHLADAYAAKPITPSALLENIKNLIYNDPCR